MAVNNTPSDAANTAVRAFLTSVGNLYLKKSSDGELDSFNVGTVKGKNFWDEIKKDFDSRCAYCRGKKKLQIEHLVMFNRTEFGLHHPGNCVPSCAGCNGRKKDESTKNYLPWQLHLAEICGGKSTQKYKDRRAKIAAHIKKHKYPKLTSQESGAIRVIAESLYENIKSESEKALLMYKKLEAEFVTSPAKSTPVKVSNRALEMAQKPARPAATKSASVSRKR
jgi:hypothetical protein